MFCELCKKEKDPSCFYKNYAHRCKECKRLYAKKYRETHLERIKEYDRNRPNAKERNEKYKIYKAKMRVENPEKYDRIFHSPNKRFRTKYKDKAHAENLLNNAIRDKKIIRPNECSVCHKICIPHGHHFDYTKPLEVIWVCPACHSKIHKELRQKARIIIKT